MLVSRGDGHTSYVFTYNEFPQRRLPEIRETRLNAYGIAVINYYPRHRHSAAP